MRDRAATTAPIAAIAGVLGLCCGLPVLVSLGVMGAVAGLSLQSWALIGLGLVLAVVGGAPRARRRRRTDPRCETGGPRAPQDPVPDQSLDTVMKGNHR